MTPAIFLLVFFCGLTLTLGAIALPFVAHRLMWISVPGSSLLQSNTPFADEELLRAMRLFEDEWSLRFGYDREVHKATWSIKIRWVNAQDFEVPTHPDIRATGWVQGPLSIWVATRPDEDGVVKLERTAFFHELVHIALYHSEGTYDPDHEGDLEDAWTEQHTGLVRECKRRFAAGDQALI